jgi:hypothetical protein
MAVLKPRSRSISIRLSEDEFLALKHICSVTGARSVSDLTRDAMRVVLNKANREDLLGFRMEEFRALLKNIDRKFDDLAARMTSVTDADDREAPGHGRNQVGTIRDDRIS